VDNSRLHCVNISITCHYSLPILSELIDNHVVRTDGYLVITAFTDHNHVIYCSMESKSNALIVVLQKLKI